MLYGSRRDQVSRGHRERRARSGTKQLKASSVSMPRYFFDTYDGHEAVVDHVGYEMPDFEAVKVEAARALADLAKEALPSTERRELTIEVRDDQNLAVLRAVIMVEIGRP